MDGKEEEWKNRKDLKVRTATAATDKAVRQAGRMCGSGTQREPHGNIQKGIELAFLFLTAQFF
jgi:hypothetical protein